MPSLTLAERRCFPDTRDSLEAPLEPGLMICDAHHHLWDRPGSRYLSDEFIADARSGHRIVSSVYVDCESMYRSSGPEHLQPLGETEFADAVARYVAADPSLPRVCDGIVGFADLRLGAKVGTVLDAHLAITARFKGIRYCTAWDPSDRIHNAPTRPPARLLEDSTFRRGFAELARRNLSFDAWVYHPQISEVAALAHTYPDTLIILDHLGGPLGIGPYAENPQSVLTDWKVSVRSLAACPNVVIKLGGIQMPLNGWGFHKMPVLPSSEEIARLTRDYYLYAIDAFGVERCMFESNYPADRPSVAYGVLWNTFKRLTINFSTAEKIALYHDTAARVYRLTPN